VAKRKRSRAVRAPDLRQQTRESLELQTILRLFAVRAQTHEGKALILKRDLLPEAALPAHFRELDDWRRYLQDAAALRFPAIPAAAEFRREPKLKPFDARELRRLRDALSFWRRVQEDEDLAFARGAAVMGEALLALAVKLEGLFQSDGEWRDDISPRFAELRRGLVGVEKQLERTLASLIQRHGDALNETMVYERNRRMTLAVKQGFRGRVPGILQDYSASGHTAFVEPQETVALQNRLTEIESEIKEELWRIRCELTAAILEFPEIAAEICPQLARMDMMQALARTAKETRCEVLPPNDEGRLHLIQARHPYLDEHFASLRQDVFELEEADANRMVAFSLSLDSDVRGLILSGANTGGKTVTLKTTGLLAWMANSGLPVPVDEGSAIPRYDAILADIGDHQSLTENLSTFASRLVNMKQILEWPSGRALALLDELGSGTDPQEGSALAQALIERLVARGFHLLATTHHQTLCTMALTHPHLDNASMTFDAERLLPIYRLRQGVPGRSHALDIAANAGFPESVMTRSRQLIDEGRVDIEAAIRALQERHADLERQKKKLRREELRLHRRIQDAKAEARKLERDREALKDKARERLGKTLDRAERELRQLLDEVASQRQRKKAVARFGALGRDLTEPFEKPEKLPHVAVEESGLPLEAWRAGDRVFLKTWLKEGTLISADRKKARLDLNGKSLTVDVGELLHLKNQGVEAKPRVTDHFEAGSDEKAAFELQLLGFRVDDALLEVDHAVDRALRKGLPFLKIIHGHGTGALKKAVRDFLRRHPARDSFETLIEEENDGVTEIRFS